ncbi:unnamed protein product [Durusdinium trenchii]|uniref:DNA (cytosine-5-)-methyltransferase n=1 Tax=Durusdinium trenchii TaxID=1381693 RepID=A0ABP0KFA1_9DINO
MSILLDPRLQPPPVIGGRYTSRFHLGSLDSPLPLFDLRGFACEIRNLPEGCKFPLTGYDLVVLTTEPLSLEVDGLSWLATPPVCDHFAAQVVDACAGLGATTMGAQFMGARVLAHFECNGLSLRHLRRNSNAPVLDGNLCSDSDLKRFHQMLDGQLFTLFAGFPCQPYSDQGSQCSQRDPRSAVYWAVLRCIMLLQAQSAVLECTPAVYSDPDIQAGLSQVQATLGWQGHQLIFDLAAQWPMHRRRWWCSLCPSSWSFPPLAPWPTSSSTTKVSSIFESWGLWSEDHEADLQLTRAELAAYGNPAFGSDRRLATLDDTMPTVLHSFGCALQGCFCGCRDRSFALSSLQTKGLRGILVISEAHLQPRFLHPVELSSLLSIPPDQHWESQPRQSLCLLGQSAAPLQALWMYSHQANAAASQFGHSRIDPLVLVHQYKIALCKQIRQTVPWAYPERPRMLKVEALDGSLLYILKEGMVTVGQLLKAESISLGWGETMCCHSMHGQMSQDTVIDEEIPVQLWSHPKRQAKPQPAGLVAVGIQHDNQLYISCVPYGSFMFEALAEHSLHMVLWLVDEDGRVYGRDYRIWSTLRLSTLSPGSFPSPSPLPCTSLMDQQACVASVNQEVGLSGHTVWHAMCSMCRSSDLIDHETLLHLHPELLHHLLADSLSPDRVRVLRHLWACSQGLAVGCFSAHGHWAVLCGRQDETEIRWTYYDGLPGHLLNTALLLAQKLSAIFELTFVDLHVGSLIPQAHGFTCGAVALAHVAMLLGLQGSFSEDHVLQLHSWLLCHQSKRDALVGYGRDDPVLAQLIDLLSSKGVPVGEVSGRAQQAMDALGRASVLQALSSKNPWQRLKATASKPTIQFKFLKPHELAAYIEQQANKRFGAELKSKKEKSSIKKPKIADIQLDPKLLTLIAGHFKDSSGDSVPQILLEQVQSEARGIAVVSRQEAQPFLDNPRSISVDALGLLITSEIDGASSGSSKVTNLRFPATYTPTEELILVNGALLLLGDVLIERHRPAGPSSLPDMVESVVVRLQVFRDEIESDWASVVDSPIKFVVHRIPILQVCEGQSCGGSCPKYQIWARRFTSLEARQAPADQAVCFTAFLRVIKPLLQPLLASVTDGIYFEPRSSTATGPDPEFVVLWLGSIPKHDAVHKLRTMGNVVGLVRMQMKFGLRVRASDAEKVHKELRPQVPFHLGRPTLTFRVHPLPHGLDRRGVEKILKEWAWKARPLQPTKGTALGGAWLIGADSPPSQSVLTAFNQDVLINQIQQQEIVERKVQFHASKKTISHASTSSTQAASSSEKTDPWLVKSADPWAKFLPTVIPGSSSGQKHIDEVAAKLKEDITASVGQNLQAQVASMAPSTGSTQALDDLRSQTDQRFKQVECSLNELRAQNVNFQSWCTEASKRMESAEQGTQQLQSNLLQVQQEVRHTADALQHSVQQSSSALRGEFVSELESKLSSQFEKFEALLCKKFRTE